ncbi:MAG: hypothetical protein WCF45_10405 [Photobacterium halotolerans]
MGIEINYKNGELITTSKPKRDNAWSDCVVMLMEIKNNLPEAERTMSAAIEWAITHLSQDYREYTTGLAIAGVVGAWYLMQDQSDEVLNRAEVIRIDCEEVAKHYNAEIERRVLH